MFLIISARRLAINPRMILPHLFCPATAALPNSAADTLIFLAYVICNKQIGCCHRITESISEQCF